MAPKLAYWPIQGRGAPIKMALAYAGVDFEDITYDMGAAEGADNHWGTQKSKLGLAFPNLPWYIDGDVKLTQSNAILRHVGRKYNLFGKDADEASEIDMLIDTSGDILAGIVKIIFDPDFDNLVVKHPGAMEPKLQQLSDYLSGGKKLPCNWLMKSDLRFTLEKLDKLSLKKNIPDLFDGTSRDFFF